MDILKKYLPHAFKATESNALVIALLIYIVLAIVGGAIIGLLASIPVIGILFSIIGALIDLYSLAGVVLSILVFVKVIK